MITMALEVFGLMLESEWVVLDAHSRRLAPGHSPTKQQNQS